MTLCQSNNLKKKKLNYLWTLKRCKWTDGIRNKIKKEKQENQNTLPLKSRGKRGLQKCQRFININIIAAFKNFQNFIKEEPSLIMFTQKGRRGWVLEIPMFVDSTVFKQQFYCSFVEIRGGCCTIGCFLWLSDPLRCLKDQLHSVPHLDVFWYHLNGMGPQKIRPKKFLQHFFHIYFM